MQYLQKEISTSILCQIEPDIKAFEIRVLPKKNVTFSFFHTAIPRNSVDLDTFFFCMSFSKQVLQVCQISKESEGVRGNMAKNLLI